MLEAARKGCGRIPQDWAGEALPCSLRVHRDCERLCKGAVTAFVGVPASGCETTRLRVLETATTANRVAGLEQR